MRVSYSSQMTDIFFKFSYFNKYFNTLKLIIKSNIFSPQIPKQHFINDQTYIIRQAYFQIINLCYPQNIQQIYQISLHLQSSSQQIIMGAQTAKQLKIPQKTMKEQVKQYTTEIQKTRRQYNRQKYKLEYQGKTLNRDLKRKIQKKEPAQSKKITAQQILKNNKMVTKYNNLDSQLQNVQFQLQQMTVNQSMQNVMTGMAKIMNSANAKMNTKNYTETMKKFITQKQKMNVINQYVQDVMGGNQQQQIQDADVDQLINQMTKETVEKKIKKRIQVQNGDLEDYQNNMKDL